MRWLLLSALVALGIASNPCTCSSCQYCMYTPTGNVAQCTCHEMEKNECIFTCPDGYIPNIANHIGQCCQYGVGNVVTCTDSIPDDTSTWCPDDSGTDFMHFVDHQPSGTVNFFKDRAAVTQDFASDDMPLVLGIAIGVPLGAAYIAVHNGVLAV